MPKVSREHTEARRRQILEGAQRAFAQHGYDGATVAKIEQETGLSRGAIFNYFGSKQDLFVELARRREPAVHAGRDRAAASTPPSARWRTRTRRGSASCWRRTRGLRHDPGFVRKLEAAYETAAPRLGPWIAERQADGTFRRDVEAVDLGRYIAIVLNGFALRVLDGEETDVDALLRLLNDTLAPRK